ncbi:hypothetical protein Tco_0233450 [Tanacetum coccineum]
MIARLNERGLSNNYTLLKRNYLPCVCLEKFRSYALFMSKKIVYMTNLHQVSLCQEGVLKERLMRWHLIAPGICLLKFGDKKGAENLAESIIWSRLEICHQDKTREQSDKTLCFWARSFRHSQSLPQISRIVKTLLLAVFHKSFTSPASFWESSIDVSVISHSVNHEVGFKLRHLDFKNLVCCDISTGKAEV